MPRRNLYTVKVEATGHDRVEIRYKATLREQGHDPLETYGASPLCSMMNALQLWEARTALREVGEDG